MKNAAGYPAALCSIARILFYATICLSRNPASSEGTFLGLFALQVPALKRYRAVKNGVEASCGSRTCPELPRSPNEQDRDGSNTPEAWHAFPEPVNASAKGP